MNKWAQSFTNVASATLNALEHIDGATPCDILWSSGPASLRYYKPESDVGAHPIVLVMPFINRFRLADLEPKYSLTRFFVRQNRPVYIVDWGEPRRIDAGLDFEDFVLKIIRRAVKTASTEKKAHLMGICLGGTLASIFAARFPESIQSLVTLVAPVDFHPMTEMVNWVQEDHFPVGDLTRAFGNMPGGMISSGFDQLKPLQTALKWHKSWEHFAKEDFAEQFMVIESWNKDNVNVPGAAYRRLICDLYRANKLAKGQFQLRNKTIDLHDITAPVLVITGKRDQICRPEAATALLEQASSERKDHISLKGGHVASIVGPKAYESLYPQMEEWMD